MRTPKCLLYLKVEKENLFMEINEITGIIIQESIKIHRDVGPGLMESVYEELLYYRLIKYHQLNVLRQGQVNLIYEGLKMNVDLRYDLMVEGKVLVELKSQETVPPVAYTVIIPLLLLQVADVGVTVSCGPGESLILTVTTFIHPFASFIVST